MGSWSKVNLTLPFDNLFRVYSTISISAISYYCHNDIINRVMYYAYQSTYCPFKIKCED